MLSVSRAQSRLLLRAMWRERHPRNRPFDRIVPTPITHCLFLMRRRSAYDDGVDKMLMIHCARRRCAQVIRFDAQRRGRVIRFGAQRRAQVVRSDAVSVANLIRNFSFDIRVLRQADANCSADISGCRCSTVRRKERRECESRSGFSCRALSPLAASRSPNRQKLKTKRWSCRRPLRPSATRH